MKQATVLRTQYLFYRREDRNWPISTLNYAFIVSFLLFGFFVFHYKTSPIFAAVILFFELSDWLDKPRCLLCDDSVTVKRKRYTYRKFRTEELYALGRYQEDGAEPILFLCAASADKLKHFANTHPKEQAIVAKHYGYAADALTEEQLRQVMLTVYLWKKAKISNPTTAMLCLTKKSWEKLDAYCATHPLPCLVLSAPEGGCYREH